MMGKENRRRIGCDGCNIDKATQRFDGFCGGRLWLCKQCYNCLINTDGEIRLNKRIGGKQKWKA